MHVVQAPRRRKRQGGAEQGRRTAKEAHEAGEGRLARGDTEPAVRRLLQRDSHPGEGDEPEEHRPGLAAMAGGRDQQRHHRERGAGRTRKRQWTPTAGAEARPVHPQATRGLAGNRAHAQESHADEGDGIGRDADQEGAAETAEQLPQRRPRPSQGGDRRQAGPQREHRDGDRERADGEADGGGGYGAAERRGQGAVDPGLHGEQRTREHRQQDGEPGAHDPATNR